MRSAAEQALEADGPQLKRDVRPLLPRFSKENYIHRGVIDMRVMKLWFSFKGRASLADLWLKYLLPMFAAAIIARPVKQALSPLLGIPIIVLFLWTQLAVYIKRLHDRDHSGWYFLLGGILIVQIWIMIEIFLLPGNLGDNTFGPDPTALAGEVADS